MTMSTTLAPPVQRVLELRQRRELAAFTAGQIDPHRLYVLAPDVAVPATAAGRFARIDNIPVILPVGALIR